MTLGASLISDSVSRADGKHRKPNQLRTQTAAHNKSCVLPGVSRSQRITCIRTRLPVYRLCDFVSVCILMEQTISSTERQRALSNQHPSVVRQERWMLHNAFRKQTVYLCAENSMCRLEVFIGLGGSKEDEESTEGPILTHLFTSLADGLVSAIAH